MISGIQMGAIVRGQVDALERPSFAIGHILALRPGKNAASWPNVSLGRNILSAGLNILGSEAASFESGIEIAMRLAILSRVAWRIAVSQRETPNGISDAGSARRPHR